MNGLHHNAKNLTGQKFGRLTVVESTDERRNGSIIWKCKCDCGKYFLARSADLRKGNTKSCGCLRLDNLRKRTVTHGMCGMSIYQIWKGIIQRCKNSNSKAYKNYGGRGIQVCNEWRNDAKAFIEWALANGWKRGLQIDRRNNNGPYSPRNCRFVTQLEQANNTRKLRWFFAYNENTGGWDEDNNQAEFARRHNIIKSGISACLRGKYKQTKNWTFQWLPN